MKKQTDAKTLWTLFKSMFVLSACTFGGGFVIVSLMKKKFVEELQWLDESEMLDITAITQSSPGPLPVNASVIIGYRMGGILGSLTAILGTIIPPMLIISVISLFYTEFLTNTYIAIALQVMRAGVAAVIMDVVWNLASNVCKTKEIPVHWNDGSVFWRHLLPGRQRHGYHTGVSWDWSCRFGCYHEKTGRKKE